MIHLEKGRGGKGDWLSRTPLCAERAQYLNEPCSYTDREIGTWGLEGEVAQWLGALAALAEGLGLVSRARVRWLTIACYSRSRGIRRPLLFSEGPHTH